MSDYVRNKVIRIKFPKEILESCNTSDPWDCEKYLKEKLGDLYGSFKGFDKYFEIEGTQDGYYIDWVFYHTYGEECGDWGNVRMLTNSEFIKIHPLFSKISPNIRREDLRMVDYCYYNCSEAPDYFYIEEENYSDELLRKDII